MYYCSIFDGESWHEEVNSLSSDGEFRSLSRTRRNRRKRREGEGKNPVCGLPEDVLRQSQESQSVLLPAPLSSLYKIQEKGGTCPQTSHFESSGKAGRETNQFYDIIISYPLLQVPRSL
jgi:hypothetical protein